MIPHTQREESGDLLIPVRADTKQQDEDLCTNPRLFTPPHRHHQQQSVHRACALVNGIKKTVCQHYCLVYEVTCNEFWPAEIITVHVKK